MAFKVEIEADIDAESNRPESKSWVTTHVKATGEFTIESENGIVSKFIATREELALGKDVYMQKFLYDTIAEVSKRREAKTKRKDITGK